MQICVYMCICLLLTVTFSVHTVSLVCLISGVVILYWIDDQFGVLSPRRTISPTLSLPFSPAAPCVGSRSPRLSPVHPGLSIVLSQLMLCSHVGETS